MVTPTPFQGGVVDPVFVIGRIKAGMGRGAHRCLGFHASVSPHQTFQVELDSSIAFIIDCSVPLGSVLGPLKFVAYAEDLPSVIEKHELYHHLYADDTQITDHLQLTQAAATITNIERCIESVHVWCTSKRLQINPNKSEIIWFESRTSVHRLHGVDLSLHIGADIIAPLCLVHDLGVLLDSELSITSYIIEISRVCSCQLERLKQVRRVQGKPLQLVLCRLSLSVDWITVMQP